LGKITIAAVGFALVFLCAADILTPAASQEKVAPMSLMEVPQGYRDWKVISVAHEEGSLKDIRAILGDEAAIRTYRDEKLPFPDSAIIVRLAWHHVSSEENNKVFGDSQSFVAGDATNVQFMFKDSRKYAATGGWGFAQFDTHGKLAEESVLKTCFPCHAKASRDLVYTRYAP
jgi:hypothetical protein